MNAAYLTLAFVLSFGAIALFRFLNLGAIFSVDATMPIFIIMFGVFMNLLNKMVLEPVGAVIEKRRQKIAADIEAASAARTTGTEVVGAYHAHIHQARQQGQTMINEATTRANQAKQAEIQRLLEKGGAKLEAAKKEIAAERDDLINKLAVEEKELVSSIVRKLIGGNPNLFLDENKARQALLEEVH